MVDRHVIHACRIGREYHLIVVARKNLRHAHVGQCLLMVYHLTRVLLECYDTRILRTDEQCGMLCVVVHRVYIASVLLHCGDSLQCQLIVIHMTYAYPLLATYIQRGRVLGHHSREGGSHPMGMHRQPRALPGAHIVAESLVAYENP